jgi:hypothetical protein
MTCVVLALTANFDTTLVREQRTLVLSEEM